MTAVLKVGCLAEWMVEMKAVSMAAAWVESLAVKLAVKLVACWVADWAAM